MLSRQRSRAPKVHTHLRNALRRFVFLPVAEDGWQATAKLRDDIGDVHARPHDDNSIHPATHQALQVLPALLEIIVGVAKQHLISLPASGALNSLGDFRVKGVGNGWEDKA